MVNISMCLHVCLFIKFWGDLGRHWHAAVG
uniref:Uncharacterized protein n=1 Tax=Mus musculus TaxID=10090 RepID=Q3TRB4_MOUSE|nr:unnamed protein product [Mus musculus]